MKRVKRQNHRAPLVLFLGFLLATGTVVFLLVGGMGAGKVFHREDFSGVEFMNALANLELAELGTNETIEWTEKARSNLPGISTLVGWLDSEAHYTIRFEVLYTYVINMEGDWHFEAQGDRLSVIAPALIPRPPAIDTSTIKKHADGGWLVFDEQGRLDQLQETLSEFAAQRALEKVDLVIDRSRGSLEKFLVTWEKQMGYEFRTVEVRFANEIKNQDRVQG